MKSKALWPILAGFFVTAILGGGVVTPMFGIAQGRFGSPGVLVALIACLSYLMVLGLFA